MFFKKRYVFRGYGFILDRFDAVFPLFYCDFLLVKMSSREYYIVFRSEDESRIDIAVEGLDKYVDMYPMKVEDIYKNIYGIHGNVSAMGLMTPLYEEVCPLFSFFIGLFIRKPAIILGRDLERRIIKFSRYGIDVGGEKTEIMKRIASLRQFGICFQHTIIFKGSGLKEKDLLKILDFKPLKKWYISPLDLQIFLRKNLGVSHEDISRKAWRY